VGETARCTMCVVLPSGLPGGLIVFEGFFGNLLRFEPGSTQEEERENKQQMVPLLGRAICQCWGPLGRRPILRRKPIFGENIYFEKDLFLERKTSCWSVHNRWKQRNMHKKKEKQHAGGKTTWHAGRQA
jgi:hypothetical protein